MAYGLSTRAFIEDGPVEQVAKAEAIRSTARSWRALTKPVGWKSSNRRSAPPMTASTNIRSLSEKPETERMVTMIDEIFDRQYQAGRDEMNAALLRRLGSRFGTRGRQCLCGFNRIEYSAPWAAKPAARRCN